MINAGEVGSSFKIVDEASPVLRRLIEQFEALDRLIKNTKISLGELKLPRGLTAGIEKMGGAFKAIEDKSKIAADAAVRSFERMDAAIARTAESAKMLGAEMRALRGPGAPRSIRSGGGGGGHGGGGLSVGGIGAHLPGGASVHAHSGSDGFWELVGGVAMTEAVKKFVESNMEMQHLQAQAMATKTTSDRMGEIMAAAWKNAHDNLNVTATESYRYILELTQVTGGVDEALRMLSVYSSAKSSLASLKDEGVKESVGGPRQLYGFARSLELLGVTQDATKLKSMSDALLQEMIGMKGLVDGSMLFNIIQNAGGSRYGWNQDFIQHVLGPLAQASPRAGAGLYQLDRSFGAGVMTQMMADNLIKYGFFKESDKFSDAHGRFKGMQTGSIEGYADLRANPEEWALKFALPLLKSHGVDIDDTNSISKAVQEISRGNKNLGVILDELLLPGTRGQLAKERQNIQNTDANASGILQANDPGLKMAALAAKWNDLMNSLGSPLTERAMNVVVDLTRKLDAMAQFFNAHPNIAGIASDAILVGGGLLILGGALKMLKFTLGGLSLLGGGGGGAAAAGGATAGAGWFARLMGLGAGAASLPALIDAATDDNRTPEAKANDDAVIAKIKKWFSPSPGSDLNPLGLNYSEYDRMRGGTDLEAQRGRALGRLNPIPPPQPVTLNETNTFNLDGQKIAEIILKRVVQMGAGAAQGSPYHDSTYSTSPLDFVTV